MIVRQHVLPDRRLVLAVCDNDLIGERVEEGDRQLDLASPFYRGEEMDRRAVLGLMKQAYLINCVGTESVGCALESSLITKENILTVKCVPTAQALRAPE